MDKEKVISLGNLKGTRWRLRPDGSPEAWIKGSEGEVLVSMTWPQAVQWLQSLLERVEYQLRGRP